MRFLEVLQGAGSGTGENYSDLPLGVFGDGACVDVTVTLVVICFIGSSSRDAVQASPLPSEEEDVRPLGR